MQAPVAELEPDVLESAVRLILDSAPTAVVGVDAAGVIVYTNPCVESMLGHRQQDVVGQPIDVLVPERLGDLHRRHVADYLEAPVDRAMAPEGQTHLWARTAAGGELAVDISLTPFAGPSRAVVLASLTDVTTRVAAERRARAQTRFYATLAETNRVILRARDRDALYQGVCDAVVRQGGYAGAWVGADRRGTVVPVAQSPGLESLLSALDVVLDPADPRGTGPTAVALRDGVSTWIPDVTADPALQAWHGVAERHGIRSAATVPLLQRGEPVAVMSIYAEDVGVFDTGMRDVLSHVAANVGHALDALALSRDFQDVAAHRAELVHRLVLAEESERKRVADDIHDEPMQTLVALSFRLDVIAKTLSSDPEHCAEQLAAVRELVDASMGALRGVLFELESGDVTEGLAELVSEAAEEILAAALDWRVEADLHDAVLSPEVVIQASRIAKEAMTNIRRHARARHARVRLGVRDGSLELEVTDDGVGLRDADVHHHPGHRGRTSMRDRAHALGGTLSFESPESGGTVVRASLPLVV